MRWDDDPMGIVFAGFIVVFAGGMVVGSGIMKPEYITEGRTQGIVLCTEKPKECAVEYQYIKLKETQK